MRLTVTTQTPANECGVLLGHRPCHPTAPQRRTLPGSYELTLGVSSVNLPLAPYGCFPASGGTGAAPNSFTARSTCVTDLLSSRSSPRGCP